MPFVFFVCLSLLPVSAQILGGSPGESADKHYKVSGTVVNSLSGEPIAHALVQVYSQSVLTDSSGHFEFGDLPEMEISLSARKPGFFSEQDTSRMYRSRDVVHVGPDTAPVTIKLTPEAVIYGQVESSGEPVERIPVILYQSTIHDGRRNWEEHQALTDEAGEFRIAELRPGNYVISAGPSLDTSALRIAGREIDFGYTEAFYSGAVEFDQATPINLAAGQQTEIDFSLKKAHAFKLSGTIVGDPSGGNAELVFQDHSGRMFRFPSYSDASGQQFYLWVPTGSYVIRAQSQDQNGTPLIAELPITINSDRSGLVLALEPMPTIPVIVHMESSQPQTSEQRRPQVRFSFGSRNAIPANAMLETTGDDLNRRNYSAYQDQGSNSQFSFRSVEPGKYNLVVRVYPPWYVQSATSGGANLLNQALEVGGGGQTIDIVLRNDFATLNVSLGAEKKRIPGAILVIRDDAPRDIKAMSVDGDGPFPVTGLAPGGYNVLAFDQIDRLEYSNPEILGRYLSRASHVNLQADQTLDVSVERIQSDR